MGSGVQMPSNPLVIASPPFPVPKAFFSPVPAPRCRRPRARGRRGLHRRPMGLAERVAARDQRDGLFVVHRHAFEGFANVDRRREWIRLPVGPFRIDVDQAHLNGRERVLEIAIAAIALVAEPLVLAAPVDVLLGLPDIRSPAAEAECLEAHRLQRAIARQDQQVGPGNLVAVFLFDRPQQPTRLV